jgi:hypothetical protein
MSLKAELDTWAAALKAYDEEDFGKSLDLFSVRERQSIIIVRSHSIHYSALPIPPRSSLTWVSYMPPLDSTSQRFSGSSKPLT